MVLNFASIYQRTDYQQTAGGLLGPPEYTMKRLLILLPLIVLTTGCQGILHELQPHRLWRLNYQEPAGRTDGVYFSVDDDLKPVGESAMNDPALGVHSPPAANAVPLTAFTTPSHN